MQPSFLIENNFETTLICGIDEAGRGPLAGPVVATCYLMNRDLNIDEINDSKKLSKKIRQKIFQNIKFVEKYGVGIVDEETIDRINILQATKMAMKMAYIDFCQKNKIYPKIILVDGNVVPFENCDEIEKIMPIVKGDQKSISIATASIIAKEIRDEIMQNYHQKYPLYGFDRHSGYGTKFHLEKINQFGICKIHRKSFEPIKSLIQCKL